MNRVLIVDDEHLIRSSLKKKLGEFCDTILVSEAVNNGKQALDWLEEHFADICITDVRMPIIDGLKLIREIKKRYPWMNCIVISSYDDFSYVQQSLQSGAVDYILKPIEQEALETAIRKAVSEIEMERENRARELLLQNMPYHRQMVVRWLQQMRTLQFETTPLLVVDTLEMLEVWVKKRLDLLYSLSMAWLHMISEELRTDNIVISVEEGSDQGLGEAAIKLDNMRFYFRLCAVRRLEDGASQLYLACKAHKDDPTRKVIEDAKQYIQANYRSKELNLQMIANQVTMSRTHLASIFKKETGVTLWNYIISLRMDKARELLLNTQMKVYEIADEVGYEDSVYFSQLFKGNYGLAPSEYKRRMEA